MKRLLPLFLLLCLLLTACSPITPPTEPSATTEPTTEAPTETETTTAPTETEPVQLEVNADFSYYSPQVPPEAMYTRLSEGPLEDLHPTATPTRILPFPGSLLINEYGGLYISEDRFKFGIVDETGCILVDPIYSAVYLLSETNSRKYLPFWILEKTTAKTELWDEYEYLNSETRCAFASIDGTFVSDCIYLSITAYEDRILAFYLTDEEDRIQFDVYDTEGTFLFSSRDLPFAGELGSGPYQFSYGEGLYVISFEERTYEPEGYYSSDYTYYYMDEYGHLVLGPYYSAEPFSNGKALVQLNPHEDYVFVNKKGTVLSEKYTSCRSLPNGNVIVSKEGLNYTYIESLLNANLETILTFPGYCHVPGDGTIQVFDDQDVTYCYSLEGEELWRRENCHILSSSLIYTSMGEPTILENIITGKTRELPADSYCTIIGDPNDPIIAVHYSKDPHDYNSPMLTLFLNQDLEEIASSSTSYTYTSYGEVGQPHIPVMFLKDGTQTSLYTDAHAIPATYPVQDCRMADLYPGQFASLTTTQCTYLFSPDGELLFAYPINPMDD